LLGTIDDKRTKTNDSSENDEDDVLDENNNKNE
jgi:hypothetical protein